MSLPTLVLLPGMDGTGTLFEPFLAALGSRYKVQVVRYPMQDALDYPALEVIARLALPRQEKFVLLGESFSGPIALSLAASKPPGLVGMVLCATFASNPYPVFAALAPLCALLPMKALPFPLIRHAMLGRYATPPLLAALQCALAKVSAAALQARLHAVLRINVCAQLQAIAVPMLYLQATDDRVVHKHAARQIADACPNMKLVAIRAPHFLLQAAPNQAAIAVQDFIHSLHNADSEHKRHTALP